MNYQNNIDAYYAYAKENHKRRRKEKKTTWLWLIASIIILFGVWAYLSNLNLLNLLDSDDNSSKNTSEKMILADDQPINDKANKNTESAYNDDFPKDIEANNGSEKSIEKEEKPYDLPSKEVIENHPGISENITNEMKNENHPGLPEKITNDMANVEHPGALDKNISEMIKDAHPTELLKGIEQNNSLDKNASIEFNKLSDINISLNKENNSSLVLKSGRDGNMSIDKNNTILKVENIEQNVSVELYHVYIVSKGETIYDIALKEYGDTKMYKKILNANQDLKNPNKIHVGQELFLPIVNESKSYSDILHFK